MRHYNSLKGCVYKSIKVSMSNSIINVRKGKYKAKYKDKNRDRFRNENLEKLFCKLVRRIEKFEKFRQFLEMTSDSWNFRISWK